MFSSFKILFYFGAILLIAVGALIMYFAVSDIIEQKQFIKKALPAQGTVADINSYVRSTGSGSSREYSISKQAIIEYTPVSSGEVIAFEHDYALLENQLAVGVKVNVYYDPSNPEDALVNSFAALWATYIAMIVFSIMFIGGGVLAFKML